MSSRFEFLGNISLGQFIPRQSWFHKRDPRARLLSFIILFTGIIFTPGTLGLFLGLIFVLIIYALAQLPVKPTWSGIIRALPFIILLAFLQILFYQSTGNEKVVCEIFGFSLADTALNSAMNLVIRFLVLIILLNAFVMSLSTSQVTAAMYHLLKPLERIGFPTNDLTMVVQITLRFLPLIAQSAEKTAKAQAARGADWEQHGINPIKQAKRVIPLIVPLIVNSLKRAETMAIAMESRGFNAAEKRSSFHILHYSWQDLALIIVLIILSLVLLFSGKVF